MNNFKPKSFLLYLIVKQLENSVYFFIFQENYFSYVIRYLVKITERIKK